MIKKANASDIAAPPTILNLIVIDSKTNSIAKYIGFLEILKIPEVTKWDAFSGRNGFTVVLYALNDKTADISVNNPKTTNKKLIKLVSDNTYFGKNAREKYIIRPHIRAITGGGILLFTILNYSTAPEHTKVSTFAAHFLSLKTLMKLLLILQASKLQTAFLQR